MDSIRAYVINLDHRPDRRREMERQLDRIGWYAEFITAIRPPDSGNFPSIGARGCFESHLATLVKAGPLQSHVIIMEDDLNFVADFDLLWPGLMTELDNKDWSMFYPANSKTSGSSCRLLQIAPYAELPCAHFVMFHRDTVSRIIDGLKAIMARPAGDPRGGPMHVDGAYNTIRQQNPDIKTYISEPSLGYQRSSRSDIADQNRFDRIKIISPLVAALRIIKQTLQHH